MAKIRVVGIGPGDYEEMTVKAVNALNACDVIVGYHVYVDLVKEHFPGKEFFTTPMRREVDRCRDEACRLELSGDHAAAVSKAAEAANGEKAYQAAQSTLRRWPWRRSSLSP